MDIFSKKRLSQWIIICLVVLNLLTLSALWYQIIRRPSQPQRLAERRPEEIQQFLVRELKLSNGQAALFEQKRREHFEATRYIQDSIFQKKGEMMNSLLSDRFDPELVENIASGIGSRQADLEKLLSHHLQDLLAICTAEQKVEFKALIRDLLEMMRPAGSRKPPPGGKGRRGKDGKGPPPRHREKR